MQRRTFLRLTTAFGLAGPFASGQKRSPNLVIILADDQGWGDLSINGNRNLQTPHIDSLARDGALFERFFVCSVCAPTRAEFLTGRYHPRGGVRGVSRGDERLNLDETTIADIFRAAGYATGCFGKWHSGTQHPYHPNSRGFDEYYGYTSGHWGDYFAPELDHNGEVVQGEGFLTDDLTNHAIRFIEKNRARPFLCYLPLNTPHSPMQVPDRFFEKFAALDPAQRARDESQESLPMTRAALAMCENIDWNVGRVLQSLDSAGLAKDTIVLYFSDNGPNSWRWNGGMRGRKGSLDEGGLRAPCLLRWPGKIPAGKRISQIAAAIDLLPTFAELAGVSRPASKPLDGKSLAPLLLSENAAWPERTIFTMQNKRVSARTQRYRLDAAGRLFDMVADPMQDRDVSAAQPEVAARLREAASAWQAEMLPFVGEDRRPFTVGFAKNTILPARDGEPHGGVERSSRHPNCSFFRHWTSTADAMTWDVEVGAAGVYEATLYYTCPAGQTGSRIELRLGESRVETLVSEPFDPPLEGKAEDRVPRDESYVKAFRPLVLGRFRLAKQTGTLTLKALSVAGSEVGDVWQVALRRV
ncbi:MAG: arylsulfatase [Bryobacterales bacterium]|nr:arylsulfatase [Bryobacterales bacterium]